MNQLILTKKQIHEGKQKNLTYQKCKLQPPPVPFPNLMQTEEYQKVQFLKWPLKAGAKRKDFLIDFHVKASDFVRL